MNAKRRSYVFDALDRVREEPQSAKAGWRYLRLCRLARLVAAATEMEHAKNRGSSVATEHADDNAAPVTRRDLVLAARRALANPDTPPLARQLAHSLLLKIHREMDEAAKHPSTALSRRST